jgi:hypothetical protein
VPLFFRGTELASLECAVSWPAFLKSPHQPISTQFQESIGPQYTSRQASVPSRSKRCRLA